MKKLKINRIHYVDPSNIEKLVLKNSCVYVCLKKGYPKILKTTETLDLFELRLTNLGLTIFDFKLEGDFYA